MAEATPSQTLRANWFHILVALASSDMHGLAIARDVLDQTDGGLRLWPATLYRTLNDMVRAGLIAPLERSDEGEEEAGRRRYYTVTPKGKAELSAAAERMVSFASTAQERLREASS